jgi:hypothetical protein
MLDNPLVLFFALLLAVAASWTLLGWVLGRFLGFIGFGIYVLFAVFSAENITLHPDLKALSEGIGLLPMLACIGAGALVSLDSARKRARRRQGPQAHP